MKNLVVCLALFITLILPSQSMGASVSKNSYVVGGIIGSLAGFGIGHAFQARYEKIGWVFTVGEGIGIFGWHILPAFIRASDTNSKSAEVISRIGLAIFAGFRTWQIVDLWLYTRPEKPILAEVMQERPWQDGWWGAQKTAEQASMISVPVLRW